MNAVWSLRFPQQKTLLGSALLAIMYFVVAWAAISLMALPEDVSSPQALSSVTPVWPSAGVALAIILLAGTPLWPGVWLGSFALHLVAHGITSVNVLAAIAIGSNNSLQTVFAAVLLKKFSRGRDLLARSQTIFKFIGIVMVVMVFSSAFGAFTLGWSGIIRWSAYEENWWIWWSSNLFGVLIFTPALLAWSRWGQTLRQQSLSHFVEFGIWLLLASCIGFAAFWLNHPLEHLLIPILVWSTFRFQQSGTMLLVVAIAAIAVGATVHEVGPFARDSLRDSLLLLQAFIGAVSLTALVLSAVILERERAKAGLVAANQALEQINDELEQRVERRTAALQAEQEKSERLLLNVLPHSIAEQLKQSQDAIAPATSNGTHPCTPLPPTHALIAQQFSEATILFADIVDFTSFSAQVSPNQLVDVLNQIFSAFDRLAEKYQLEKIKTVGDEYMIVGGLPQPMSNHAEAIADMALEMQAEIGRFNRLSPDDPFRLRIGINTGSVVAGVIGIKKFSYDLWGDAVNVASRMETHGDPGSIQVTASTYEHLKDRYILEDRGAIAVKGKGTLRTYWLLGKKA